MCRFFKISQDFRSEGPGSAVMLCMVTGSVLGDFRTVSDPAQVCTLIFSCFSFVFWSCGTAYAPIADE